MKPSERIKEIYKNIPVDDRHSEMYQRVESILQYLDEEWEKEQAVEVDPYQEKADKARRDWIGDKEKV